MYTSFATVALSTLLYLLSFVFARSQSNLDLSSNTIYRLAHNFYIRDDIFALIFIVYNDASRIDRDVCLLSMITLASTNSNVFIDVSQRCSSLIYQYEFQVFKSLYNFDLKVMHTYVLVLCLSTLFSSFRLVLSSLLSSDDFFLLWHFIMTLLMIAFEMTRWLKSSISSRQ